MTDWIHDRPLGLEYKGKPLRIRPDYRSETLRMVVEFDGIQHYQQPDTILKDRKNTMIYEELGYRVVGIPFSDIDDLLRADAPFFDDVCDADGMPGDPADDFS